MATSVMQNRDDNRPNPAHQGITHHDFATSNSTSHHFLGAPQRSWMTGIAPQPLPGPPLLSTTRKDTARRPSGQVHDIDGQINGVNGEPASGHAARTPQGESVQAPNLDLPEPESSAFTHRSSSSMNRNGIPILQTTEDGHATIQLARARIGLPDEVASTSPEDLSTDQLLLANLQPLISYAQPATHPVASTSTLPGTWQSFTGPEPLSFLANKAPPIMTFSATGSTPPNIHPIPPKPANNSISNAKTMPAAILPQPYSLDSPISVSGPHEARKRSGQAQADTSNKRARQSATQAIQVPPPTVTSVPVLQQAYVEQLETVIKGIREQRQLNGTEEARITLLTQACSEQDLFFMVLHQLYSLASVSPQSVTTLGFGAAEKAGLTVVEPILVSNKQISPALLGVFANFPRQFRALHEAVMSRTVEQVKDFLVSLGTKWQNLRQICLTRRFPPCCEEFICYISVCSQLTQKTLYVSLERQISVDQNPLGQVEAVRLFVWSQDRYKRQHRDPNYRIEQVLTAVRQEFGWEYQKLQSFGGASQSLAGATSPSAHRVPNTRPATNLQSNHSGTLPYAAGASGQAQWINPYYRNNTIPTSQANVHQAGQPFGPPTTSSPAQHFLPSSSSPSQQHWRLPSSQFRLPSQVVHPSTHPVRPADPPNSTYGQSNSTGFNTSLQEFAPPRRQSISAQVPAASNAPLQEPSPARRRGRLPKAPSRASGPAAPPEAMSASHASSRQHNNLGANGQSSVAPLPQTGIGPIQGQYLHSVQRSMPNTPSALLPPPVYVMPLTVQPNTDRIALHQVHLRSPPCVKVNAQDHETDERLYAYTESFALLPQRFDPRDKYVIWHFEIPEAIFATRAVLIAPSTEVETSGRRAYTSGCLVVRLKCTKRAGTSGNLSPAEFSEAGINWPSCAFFSLNGTQDVELRRKSHWGRDLTADLTDLIQERMNTLTLSYHGVPPEEKDTYYVAVEIVRVHDHSSVRALAQTVDEPVALNAIIAPLKTAQDDEISFADPTISIDLIDPFMARIWETPARGERCKHRECFDLESFLLSRSTRQQDGPTDADRWNCPICSKDARPHHLVIDQFLVNVKAKVEADGKLDARAILVRQDGTWEVKMVDERDIGARRASGTKSKSASIQPEVAAGLDLAANTAMTQAKTAQSAASPNVVINVIEIEDDDN